MFDKDRTGTGTREWSEFSFNVGRGCSNNCLYCYARSNALRYKTIDDPAEWTKEVVSEKAIDRAGSKRSGVIMFPTTHDITPTYLEPSIKALKKMLAAGNNVLIVSKPRVECISKICEELEEYKEQILFRFTIGTLNDTLIKTWEPGAPLSGERVGSLIYAYHKGFNTSVSMEPFLGDVGDVVFTFLKLEPFVNEKIWIGKMNKISSRVKEGSIEIKEAIDLIETRQREEPIKWLYEVLRDHPKAAWKDSIKQVVGLDGVIHE